MWPSLLWLTLLPLAIGDFCSIKNKLEISSSITYFDPINCVEPKGGYGLHSKVTQRKDSIRSIEMVTYQVNFLNENRDAMEDEFDLRAHK